MLLSLFTTAPSGFGTLPSTRSGSLVFSIQHWSLHVSKLYTSLYFSSFITLTLSTGSRYRSKRAFPFPSFALNNHLPGEKFCSNQHQYSQEQNHHGNRRILQACTFQFLHTSLAHKPHDR